MGKNPFPYFSPASLRRAQRRLSASGMSHREFADSIGVSVNTIRDLLYGRVAGIRGDAHRAAIALGLKKRSMQLPSPLSYARKPDAYQARIIRILRHYRLGGRRFAESGRRAISILSISETELARLHGFNPAAVRRAFERYLGRTDRKPPQGTEPWLIMFAAGCATGNEVCKGMTEQIRRQTIIWEKHLGK